MSGMQIDMFTIASIPQTSQTAMKATVTHSSTDHVLHVSKCPQQPGGYPSWHYAIVNHISVRWIN